MEQKFLQEHSEIDITSLEKGIYILKLINSEKAEVVKFVKE